MFIFSEVKLAVFEPPSGSTRPEYSWKVVFSVAKVFVKPTLSTIFNDCWVTTFPVDFSVVIPYNSNSLRLYIVLQFPSETSHLFSVHNDLVCKLLTTKHGEKYAISWYKLDFPVDYCEVFKG